MKNFFLKALNKNPTCYTVEQKIEKKDPENKKICAQPTGTELGNRTETTLGAKTKLERLMKNLSQIFSSLKSFLISIFHFMSKFIPKNKDVEILTTLSMFADKVRSSCAEEVGNEAVDFLKANFQFILRYEAADRTAISLLAELPGTIYLKRNQELTLLILENLERMMHSPALIASAGVVLADLVTLNLEEQKRTGGRDGNQTLTEDVVKRLVHLQTASRLTEQSGEVALEIEKILTEILDRMNYHF